MNRPAVLLIALWLVLLGGSPGGAQVSSSQGGGDAPKGRPFTLPDLVDTPATPPKASSPPPTVPPAPGSPATPPPVMPAVRTELPREGAFADAAYVTRKAFLAALKDVSVAIHAPAATTRWVPESEIRADVAEALDDYGIAITANSTVRLDVTISQKDTTFIWNDDRSDTQDMHDVFVSLSFQTTGVVRRGTKLYAIVASPAQAEVVGTVTQNNSIRRAFFGDETKADMQEKIPELVRATLEAIANNDAVDTTPWYAAKWNAAQKAAGNAEFTALMKGATVAADHFAALDVLPAITSNTTSDAAGCRLSTRYGEEWRTAFRTIGWTRMSEEAPLSIEHSLRCDYIDTYNTPKYTRVWNSVDLREPNFVFVLHGRVVRKPAVIHSWNVLMVADGADEMAADIDELFDQVKSAVEPLRESSKTAAAR